MMALVFPTIDPVLVSVGGFSVRWYGLMYIAAFLIGHALLRRLVQTVHRIRMTDDQLGELVSTTVLGVILGGRLGYVLFYNLPYYIEHPLEIVAVWNGGMSFHGGLIGVALVGTWFIRKYHLSLLALGDLMVGPSALGLMFGRIGNFINAELPGRPTDLPWGMYFPGELVARHPSQLYAAGKDLFLFLLLWVVYHRAKRDGTTLGVFLAGYGLLRFLVEFTREPDVQVGFIGPFTEGQLLSIPLMLLGAWLLVRGYRATSSMEDERGTTVEHGK